MTRRCPAAAYLSTISGQDSRSVQPSSTFNTEDLVTTRSFDHKRAFLMDLVDFMYRCHAYVKKAKEGQPKGKEFTLSDAERKENLQTILNIIMQREKESKGQRAAADARQNRSKICFDPRGKSTPTSAYAGQTQLTGSPVSPVSNLMGSRDFSTPPRVYKSSQGSTGFSLMMSQLQDSSSVSTDTGSPDVYVRCPQTSASSRISTRPAQNLSTTYPSFSSYTCPYKQRCMSAYASSRTQNRSPYAASAASAYQRSYISPSIPQNVTAQTSFYEYARGGEPAEYYEDEGQVDLNTAFIEDEDYVTEYDEDDGQEEEYTAYAPPRGIRCACK